MLALTAEGSSSTRLGAERTLENASFDELDWRHLDLLISVMGVRWGANRPLNLILHATRATYITCISLSELNLLD